MGILGNIFSTGHASVALVDIGSGSVAGAYLSHGKNGHVIEYSVRVPVRIRDNEEVSSAMLRALAEVDEKLVKEGAPLLRRATGSGSVGEVFVSVASPWQETTVRTERFEETSPVTFTRSLMRELVHKTAVIADGRVSSGESVIATMLNGYETSLPFGKRVNRADIVILSSTLDTAVASAIETALRATYHTRSISFTAFASLTYTVFRDIFPHEKDYLIVDVTGEATDIVFVKRGLLASVVSVPLGVSHLVHSLGTLLPTPDMHTETGKIHITKTNGGGAAAAARSTWVGHIVAALKTFSEHHALPRTIFLLADDPVREYIRRALDDESLRSLWLSDEPLSILPVLASHFLPRVTIAPTATGDTFLMMLALYHGKRIHSLIS